jgi:hypothetical protein
LHLKKNARNIETTNIAIPRKKTSPFMHILRRLGVYKILPLKTYHFKIVMKLFKGVKSIIYYIA